MTPAEHVLRVFKEFRAAVLRDPLRQTMKYLHRHNLSFAAIVTLMTLRERGDESISDLAREVGLSVAATSQLVERLVQDGLVKRTADPLDRRRKHVALTPRGTAFLARVDGEHTSAAAALLRRVPEANLRRLARALDDALLHLPARR